jgi:hypothetical protein
MECRDEECIMRAQEGQPTIEVRQATSRELQADADQIWRGHENPRGRACEERPAEAIVVACRQGEAVAVAEVRRNASIVGLNRFAVVPAVDAASVHDAFIRFARAAVGGSAVGAQSAA